MSLLHNLKLRNLCLFVVLCSTQVGNLICKVIIELFSIEFQKDESH